MPTPPHCPACGFTVFNRRHPRCESCHAELPPGCVYSAAELTALRAHEAQADAHTSAPTRPPATTKSHPHDGSLFFASDSAPGSHCSDAGGGCD
nr:hypothetical protein [uncultured Albidiferax sp.]